MAAVAAQPAFVGSNQYGLDAELFTGKEAGQRGETMVQKHREKLQAEKEDLALEKARSLMPQMGLTAIVAALKETDFEPEQAVSLLRRFSNEHEEQLKAVQKKRAKLMQQAKEAAEEAAGSSSDSSGSDSGSSSGSDSEADRKRHSKRKKEKGKRGKRKRSSKDKKKKDSKDGSKMRAASRAAGENFGKYGIIRETDASAKSSEFILWALDVKKVDVETMAKPDERELFRDYIEEYNTATLPHRKYYNLEAYEKYKAAKRAARGLKTVEKKKSALDDEQELRQARAEEAARLREQRMKEAYQELKFSDKAKDMKEQELLRLQMQTAYRVGDKALAQKIMERLLPDDQKPAK